MFAYECLHSMDEDTTTYDDATIYDIMDVLLCLYLMMYGFGYKAF